MANLDETVLDRASRSWREACRDLGVRVTAPFTLEPGRSSLRCLAFLPDFGGPKGMIIGAMNLPDTLPDDRLTEATKQRGLYLSFVNASAFAIGVTEEDMFKCQRGQSRRM